MTNVNNELQRETFKTIEKARAYLDANGGWLIDLADKHQVTLTGNVKRVGDEGLTVNQLRRWYKRNGFHVNRHLEMQRPPKQMENG